MGKILSFLFCLVVSIVLTSLSVSARMAWGSVWSNIISTPYNTSTANFTFLTNGNVMFLDCLSSSTNQVATYVIDASTLAITTNTNALSGGHASEIRAFRYNYSVWAGFFDSGNANFLSIVNYTNAAANGYWISLGVTNTVTTPSYWGMAADNNTNIYVTYSDATYKLQSIKVTNGGTNWVSTMAGLPMGVSIRYTLMNEYTNAGLYSGTTYLAFKQNQISLVPKFYYRTNGASAWVSVSGLGSNPLGLSLVMNPFPTLGYIDYTNFTYIPRVVTYTPTVTNMFTNFYQSYPFYSNIYTNFSYVAVGYITNVYIGYVNSNTNFLTNLITNLIGTTVSYVLTDVTMTAIGAITDYQMTDTCIVGVNITNIFAGQTNIITNVVTTVGTNVYTNLVGINYPATNVTTNLSWHWINQGFLPFPKTSQFYEMSIAKDSTNNLYLAILNNKYILSVYWITNIAPSTQWIKITNTYLPATPMRNIEIKVSPTDIPYILYQLPQSSGSNTYNLIRLK